MLVMALALASTWTLDVPVALHAHAPVGNVDTAVEPWVGLRLGRALDDIAFDGALWFGGNPGVGTAQVSASHWLVTGEGRALWRQEVVRSTLSSLSAYGFAGAGGGGGAAQLTAFDDARVRPLVTWHARGGGGGEMRIHGVVTRLELSAGLRDLQLEISSALAIGLRF